MKEGPTGVKSRIDTIAQVGVLLASLGCASNTIEAAEIPAEATWSKGIELLSKGSEYFETGALFVRTRDARGKQRDQWIGVAEGHPTRPRPVDSGALAQWAASNRMQIVCSVDIHNHPSQLMEQRYQRKIDTMPPGTEDMDAIRRWKIHSNYYGFGKTYAVVADGLGIWTYTPLPSMNGDEMSHLADSHQWPKKLGSAVMTWINQANRKTRDDVSSLLSSDAYRNLVVEYANVGLRIDFQSLMDAQKMSPCDRL